MLNRLFSTIKRGSRKIGQRGYTLIEVAAVVAITATLAAVVVPIAVDKVKEGKLAAAKDECQKIGVAITGFYKDTGEWPAYGPYITNKNHYYVLRSGIETGNLNAAVTALHDPQGAASLWGGYLADILENHLVKDNPGGTANGYKNTHTLNWKGPYSESLTKRDPWGNNYLVWIKAMHTPSGGGTANTPTTKEYGWIISAGPNGILETAERSNSLVNDDIGVMLYAAERGR